MLLSTNQIKRFREKPSRLINTLWIWSVVDVPIMIAPEPPFEDPLKSGFLAKIVSVNNDKATFVDNTSRTHFSIIDIDHLLSPYCGFLYLGIKESNLKSLTQIGYIWRVTLPSSGERVGRIEELFIPSIYSNFAIRWATTFRIRHISMHMLLKFGRPTTESDWVRERDRVQREEATVGPDEEISNETLVEEEQLNENTAPTAWSRLQEGDE